MLLTRPRYRFSVSQYDRLIDHGILTENHQVELIRGEVLDKTSIGEPHSGCINRLNSLLWKLYSARACVAVQNPVRLDDSEPEPDVVLLKPSDDFYSEAHPESPDVLLLIEVADSSLDFDRGVKIPLYAENGIVECWIVNLLDRTLEVYRNPQHGSYADTSVLRAGDAIELLSLPGTTIAVADILGVK